MISEPEQLTEDIIPMLEPKQLLDCAMLCFEISEIERPKIQALMKIRAKEFGLATEINQLFKAYSKIDKQNAAAYTRESARKKAVVPLTFDENGVPSKSIDNMLSIMRNDDWYQSVRYNQLKNAPEYTENGDIKTWEDPKTSESKWYIEKNYHIYHDSKHMDALRIFFRERAYHPIRDIVDKLEWDGVERIPTFLAKWMLVEDNRYSREVSRLIFAGGINRLYNPGCKFDDVPVLIGTSQGEGKSTIVRFLAIEDKFFTEITEVEGQKSIEQLDGAWMCEVAELLALTRSKEQEAVKAYITRQRDKCRRPYDRHSTEYPRQCIFVGTTNNEQFLKDKTGNRRFYPIAVHSKGTDLYDNETALRAYIKQCWAEARVKMERGKMPPYADVSLMDLYRSEQDRAMEDDWRVGVIEEYLSHKPVGSLVCLKQIFNDALSENPEHPKNPTKKESCEVATIMRGFYETWENVGNKRIHRYGSQKCWQKKRDQNDVETSDLPF